MFLLLSTIGLASYMRLSCYVNLFVCNYKKTVARKHYALIVGTWDGDSEKT